MEIGRGREATVYVNARKNSKTGKVELYAVRVPRAKRTQTQKAHTLRLCALPTNPHVVRILQADSCTGLLLLEYVNGGTLADELVCGEMSNKRAEAVIAQVLRGLAHLHAHGLVHGDVCPDNVLIGYQNDECKLTDYFMQPQMSAPAYTAPEAARGEACQASDVWSTGCLMLAVTGLPPWHDAEVRLEDGSLLDLGSPAALLYHLASREIAMRGPPEFSACKNPTGMLFFAVMSSIFEPARKRASVQELLNFRFR